MENGFSVSSLKHNPKKELEQIKWHLKQNFSSYPHPNQIHWNIFKTKWRSREIVDPAKNLATFKKRVANFGIVLRHVVCNFCIHFFVLGVDKNQLVIFNYILDYPKIISEYGCLARVKVAIISDHSIIRARERCYTDILEAIYVCSQAAVEESFRLFKKEGQEQNKITDYSESEAYTLDGNVVAVGYEPRAHYKDLFGTVIIKTFISKRMVRDFNHQECSNELYYHHTQVPINKLTARAIDNLISSISMSVTKKEMPQEILINKQSIDATTSLSDLVQALNKK